MEFTIEMLDKFLIHKNIEKVESFKLNDSEFERWRSFKIMEEEYDIEWWVNGCYLHHRNLTIPFDLMIQSGTWPNKYKLNLQFYHNDNICCIIPLKEYGEKK